MAKKRKSDANRLDEVKRGMYLTFCSAANSLSQIYTQAMNQQKVSFQAGERHALLRKIRYCESIGEDALFDEAKWGCFEVWLVNKINNSIGQDPDSKVLIGVLDIYGFESFKMNMCFTSMLLGLSLRKTSEDPCLSLFGDLFVVKI
ncbi:uncharacterized protein A4U43_C09F9660 [Asparagus officinalis]|uniref:Myosin motor domain-containing protein n=1 Tax=Asparagus officinalis TaxID=4686 RepID=A0A5P1E6E3_ASPOF|nr:uncharacterized protein A4U43_C09F9660 [Asparagus officinalis]